ncbi:MAG TPA: DUF1579 family protein [Longimicrobiales bacterium]|nr:DUF1579 family protein [Longimicrobiales bacterium]
MNEANIPNPALKEFTILVGRWKTIGTHPYVPNVTFHGQSTFEWIEGGAFLVMRSEMDEPEIPSGIAIFGSDDADSRYFISYFDERGVSRQYECSMNGNELKWWRESDEFSQRFTITIAEDGASMRGGGEMSKDGGPWEQDLQLTYTRVET